MDLQPVRVRITDLSPGWDRVQPNMVWLQVQVVGRRDRTLALNVCIAIV